jgi:hypothetical protein
MDLIENDGCVFDQNQLRHSHGFELLDPVGREAFVNPMHMEGENAAVEAESIIESWIKEMRLRWPGRIFRIYPQIDPTEITIRFHQIRPGVPNWCEQDIEIITVTT